MRTPLLRLPIVLASVLLLAGCGGGGGGGGGTNGGGGGGSITDAGRMTSLSQTGDKFKTLLALPPTEAAQQMADYLKQRPEFEDAGIAEDGTVWGRFTDGRLALFVNSRKELTKSAPAVTWRSVVGRSADYPSDMPATKEVVLAETLGGSFGLPATELMMMLDDRGYSDSAKQSVDDLKTVKNAGVFYIDAHGGMGNARDEQNLYGVWTGTVCDFDNDVKYTPDLAAHRLIYMYAVFDTPAGEPSQLMWRYAFTRYFVKEYMTFASSSLVVVDACSSMKNVAFYRSFIDAHATAYVGWDATADANCTKPAILRLFDRLTGSNWTIDGGKESPDQRPFDWKSILKWMQDKHFDYGQVDGSCHLQVYEPSGSSVPFGTLNPSIAFLFVKPYDKELYIYGIFGADPGSDGKVTVGGSPLTIKSWGYSSEAQMDMIIAEIPYEGAGSYGDVQVAVREHKSNVRQLSIYRGNFKFTHETGDGRQFEIDHYLRFRVDLQSLRFKPGTTPVYAQGGGPNPQYINADQMSYADFKASGAATVPDGTTIAWSGNDTLLNNIDGSGNPRGFIATAWFDPASKKARIYLTGGVENGIIETITDPQGHVTTRTTSIVFGVDEFDGKDVMGPYVEFTLNDDYSMPKTTRDATKAWAQYAGTDTAKIEWDQITCTSPPKADAARSVTIGRAATVRRRGL